MIPTDRMNPVGSVQIWQPFIDKLRKDSFNRPVSVGWRSKQISVQSSRNGILNYEKSSHIILY